VQYGQVGEFGYLLFPDVESDLLKSFGSSNPFINFSRIGMAVVCLVKNLITLPIGPFVFVRCQQRSDLYMYI
jgi:hypothetical protein